ncbi:GntR family transcriptional regulator [Chakrabartyella piscis]|uniref:GntR family transcriptional regulator n=1 Tax=Chakrabartyella piscis TaxID=2918914 RepID=UPI00295852EF|nr:GntR family transcriptional regulator [Chakrabartyella piscis]
MNGKSPLQILAYNYLKEQILTGQMKVNTLYSGTKISEEIGISRTPMREAIQCLSQDGYIEVVASQGFRLRKLEQKDMYESIQTRCAIEGFCTHLLIESKNEKEFQELMETLRNILTQQEIIVAGKKDGPTRWKFIELDHQFHLVIVDFADNDEFRRMFQRLMHSIQLTSMEALAIPGRMQETLAEHKIFFEYLEKGDANGAYQVLLNHLRTPLRLIH